MVRRSKNKGRVKVVDFFAGIKTPSKLDDRRVRFLAREKVKNPTAAPKELTGGINVPKLKFDQGFGLGEPDLFRNKIGIDPNFGKGAFRRNPLENEFARAAFESELADADFVNQPSAIDPVPADVDIDIEMEEQFSRELDDQVPTLLDSIPKINQGRRIPLTDEETSRKRKTKRKREAITDSGFEDVRFKQLQAGDTPLTPEEERNFELGRAFRGQR